MRTHFFNLVVDRDLVNEADSDLMFEVLEGNATPAVMSGIPKLMCSIDAESLIDALRTTIWRVKRAGVGVVRIEMEPDAVDA